MKSLSKNQWIGVAVALVVIAIFFLSRTFIFSFLTSDISSMNNTDNSAGSANDSVLQQSPASTSDTGLSITDTVVGTGAEAVSGKLLTVNYSGMLTNGQVFDSSYSRNKPFQFTLGAGQVIAGWDQGFAGMKVGGKRHLVIPPNLGYGSQAIGNIIPANSTLIFDVELVNVQ